MDSNEPSKFLVMIKSQCMSIIKMEQIFEQVLIVLIFID